MNGKGLGKSAVRRGKFLLGDETSPAILGPTPGLKGYLWIFFKKGEFLLEDKTCPAILGRTPGLKR